MDLEYLAQNRRVIAPDELDLIKLVDSVEGTHPTRDVLEQAHLMATGSLATRTTKMAIRAACNTHYHAQRNSGVRPTGQIEFIVMHCTQGPSAIAAASWFANPSSAGSAHLCLDDRICYRTLGDGIIPWGAPGANYHGFHIEMAGFVSYPTLVWKNTHRLMLERAAFKAALHCKKFGIPVVYLDAHALPAGHRGITTHLQCTHAFGGDHTDPGTHFPMSYFIRRVQAYRAEL